MALNHQFWRDAMGKAKINYRLYASLLVMGLCPAIYQAVRIFFLGQMPDPGAYSIAGQLSWVQLLYEIVQETVLLPLYFFLGQVVSDNVSFGNRVRSGLWLTAGIWTALAVAVSAFARPLLGWMAAAPDIIEASCDLVLLCPGGPGDAGPGEVALCHHRCSAGAQHPAGLPVFL